MEKISNIKEISERVNEILELLNLKSIYITHLEEKITIMQKSEICLNDHLQFLNEHINNLNEQLKKSMTQTDEVIKITENLLKHKTI